MRTLQRLASFINIRNSIGPKTLAVHHFYRRPIRYFTFPSTFTRYVNMKKKKESSLAINKQAISTQETMRKSKYK